MEKAQDKFKLIQDQKNFESLVSNVKTFIADRQWPEAKEIIKVLHGKYPDRSDIIRNLRKQILMQKKPGRINLVERNIYLLLCQIILKSMETSSKIDRPSKDSSFDDFFGSDSPKGNSLGQNKGKSVPSNTNSQKRNLQVIVSLILILLN